MNHCPPVVAGPQRYQQLLHSLDGHSQTAPVGSGTVLPEVQALPGAKIATAILHRNVGGLAKAKAGGLDLGPTPAQAESEAAMA